MGTFTERRTENSRVMVRSFRHEFEESLGGEEAALAATDEYVNE